MKVVSVTQARMGSTRLPGKVLMKINGVSLLEMHFARILRCKKINEFILASSDSPKDFELKDTADKMGVLFFQGSEQNVLDRFYLAVKNSSPDYVVRLTADCPLIDPLLIDKVIQFAIDNQLDYATNILIEEFPDGQDVEVFTFAALEKAWKEAALLSEKEHVTPYIRNNSTFKGGVLFSSAHFPSPKNFHHIRMTVDEQVDFDVINELVKNLGMEKSWEEYVRYMQEHNLTLNSAIQRNEGYIKSLKNEQ
jgi:spore coat polysaccharide biosynthesis protein SpsF